MGETSEGVACLNEAIRINPFGAVDCFVGKGLAEYTACHYEAAIKTFGKVSGLALLREACLAACFAQLGRKSEANTAFMAAVALVRSHLVAQVGEEVSELDAYLDAICHFRNPDNFEHLMDGLRKAGSRD